MIRQRITSAITITAIATLSLSSAPKAEAFSFGNLLGGLAQDVFGVDIAQDISLYTNLGKALLGVINGKSLDSLLAVLPGILNKIDIDGLAECSDPAIDCDSLLGKAGSVDWENVSDAVEKAVTASISQSDADFSNGSISAGYTDERFRPRITTQIKNSKIAAWAQLQDSQHKAFFGSEGQDYMKQASETDNKILEQSINGTMDVQELDNTQDIVKKGEVNKTLGLALQQSGNETQRQTQKAILEGNQTETQQLTLEQEKQWKEEIIQAQSQQSVYLEGEAFAEFIGSAYSDQN